MKDNTKKIATLLYVAAALSYLSSLIFLFSGEDTSLGVIFLCLGSSFLCLAAVNLNEWKKAAAAKKQNEQPGGAQPDGAQPGGAQPDGEQK